MGVIVDMDGGVGRFGPLRFELQLPVTDDVATVIVNGGGKVDHMGGSIVGLRLS